MTLTEIIRVVVKETLAANDGNVAASARVLGISPRALFYWRAGRAPTPPRTRRIVCERCRRLERRRAIVS